MQNTKRENPFRIFQLRAFCGLINGKDNSSVSVSVPRTADGKRRLLLQPETSQHDFNAAPYVLRGTVDCSRFMRGVINGNDRAQHTTQHRKTVCLNDFQKGVLL